MALNTSWSNRLIADLQEDFGLSLGAAQGFAGALAMESEGFNTFQERAPTVAGSRGGYGMAQWTGPRRVAFENYAAQQGLDIASYEAQYGYLRQELKGVGGHDGGIIRKLREVDDPQEAQKLVTGSAASGTGFLRPGVVHPRAREAWTQDVVTAYVQLPPGELPSVGTKLDVGKAEQSLSLADRVNQTLDSLRPIPAARSQGTAARTNAMLNAPQMPPKRPERTSEVNPTEPKQASLPLSGYEYAPNGQPRDPDNGFLMDPNDPRYNEAMGIPETPAPLTVQKQAPIPAPRSQRPITRLPELVESTLPSKRGPQTAAPQSGIERQAPIQPGQSQIERNKPKPGQSQIERNPQRVAATLPMLDMIHGEVDEFADAQAARDQILLEEATKLEERQRTGVPPKSNGMSNKPTREDTGQAGPKKSAISPVKPGVIRTANPQAGNVALPPGVRPSSIPDMTQIAATLPSGSNPRATSFPGKEKDDKVTLTAPPPALTVRANPNPPSRPVNPTPQSIKGIRNGGQDKNAKKSGILPALPMTTIPSVNITADTTKKSKPVNVFETIGEAVSGLFDVMGGFGNPLKDLGKALHYAKRPMTSKIQANADKGMSPAQAYEATNRQASDRAIAQSGRDDKKALWRTQGSDSDYDSRGVTSSGR